LRHRHRLGVRLDDNEAFLAKWLDGRFSPFHPMASRTKFLTVPLNAAVAPIQNGRILNLGRKQLATLKVSRQ
jgi:hypothetical protein